MPSSGWYRKVGNWDITGTYTNYAISIAQVGIENLTINFIMIPTMKNTHLSPTFAFQSYILVGILTRCDQFTLTPVSAISETTRLLQNAMQKNSTGDND